MALFMELGLDTLVAMRTAPTLSWGNPMERVMSVLNLGLKAIALAREEISNKMEKIFKKCNGMGEVWSTAKGHEREVVGPPLVFDMDAH